MSILIYLIYMFLYVYRYAATLEACALHADLSKLPDGDQTVLTLLALLVQKFSVYLLY